MHCLIDDIILKINLRGACDFSSADRACFDHPPTAAFAKTDVPARQKNHRGCVLVTDDACLHFHFLPLWCRFTQRTEKIGRIFDVNDAFLAQAVHFIDHKQAVPRAVLQLRDAVQHFGMMLRQRSRLARQLRKLAVGKENQVAAFGAPRAVTLVVQRYLACACRVATVAVKPDDALCKTNPCQN